MKWADTWVGTEIGLLRNGVPPTNCTNGTVLQVPNDSPIKITVE